MKVKLYHRNYTTGTEFLLKKFDGSIQDRLKDTKKANSRVTNILSRRRAGRMKMMGRVGHCSDMKT